MEIFIPIIWGTIIIVLSCVLIGLFFSAFFFALFTKSSIFWNCLNALLLCLDFRYFANSLTFRAFSSSIVFPLNVYCFFDDSIIGVIFIFFSFLFFLALTIPLLLLEAHFSSQS